MLWLDGFYIGILFSFLRDQATQHHQYAFSQDSTFEFRKHANRHYKVLFHDFTSKQRDMIRIQALYQASRYSLYGKARPSVARFASNSSTSTRDGHEPGVKSFDEIPEQGTVQTILTLIRKGGTKNLFNIQSGKFEKFRPIFKEKIFGKQTACTLLMLTRLRL